MVTVYTIFGEALVFETKEKAYSWISRHPAEYVSVELPGVFNDDWPPYEDPWEPPYWG